MDSRARRGAARPFEPSATATAANVGLRMVHSVGSGDPYALMCQNDGNSYSKEVRI